MLFVIVYTTMCDLLYSLRNYPQMAHNLFILPRDLWVHLSLPFCFLSFHLLKTVSFPFFMSVNMVIKIVIVFPMILLSLGKNRLQNLVSFVTIISCLIYCQCVLIF